METIKGEGYTLKWNGKEVLDWVEENMEEALGVLGLAVEAEAKKELRPGHGVRTGTLRRSIHSAEPGYIWAKDDWDPEQNKPGPKRGGLLSRAKRKDGKLVVEVGSGVHYALLVHQGHDGFAGYHFMTNAVEKVSGKAGKIIEYHMKTKA